MQLVNYLSKDDVTLSVTDSVAEVLAVFKELQYTHLPVVKNNSLLGMLALEDVLLIAHPLDTIENYGYLMQPFYSIETDTLFEVFSVYAVNNSNIVPVLDKDLKYLGYLDVADTISVFSELHFIQTLGVTIVLEKETDLFSVAQVAQIVESNQNELLGFFVSYKDAQKTQLVFKIKNENVNEIIQSLRRYHFNIINEVEGDVYLERLKENSNYFSTYLNI